MGKWMHRGAALRRRSDAADELPAAGAPGARQPVSHGRNDQTTKGTAEAALPAEKWRARNAVLLTGEDRRLGHDPGGYCAIHRRPLSYPEQKREACSWCVPVDPEREPEYLASRWRRFTEGQ